MIKISKTRRIQKKERKGKEQAKRGKENMVRWTRSAQIASGKGMQAIQWAKEITEWANKKYNFQMKVYLDYFGEVGTIRWFIHDDSLGRFGES